jgi:osmoprotectant transport system permease protein
MRSAFPTARPAGANRVLCVLLATGALAGGLLPFVTHSPNRIASGIPVALWHALMPWHAGLLAGGGVILAGAAVGGSRLMKSRTANLVVLVVALPMLLGVMAGAGDYAARIAGPGTAAARVSLGASFWVLVFCIALAMVDSFQRLGGRVAARFAYAAVGGGAVAALLASGMMDRLSILQEYAGHRDEFRSELLTHLMLVSTALVPAILIGLPLGLLVLRRPGVQGWLLGGLNVLQTIPSIALFAILLGPLSALGDAVPALKAVGVQGIGAAPAVIALVLYSLLPIVRNTHAGFAGVPSAVVEAARGMGMTPVQRLWRVEVPLAVPVILSGLRIVIVQAIGLTVVAALIGAGGLGRFIFQGLGEYAVDLVLLGAVPTILLAVAADFLMQILVAMSRRRGAP